MTTTIDGIPWKQARPFGDDGPTYEEWNRDALAPLSKAQGFCLCYHPFANVINFDGFTCGLCEQTAESRSHGAEAKRLRTEATLITYPHLRRESNDQS